MTPVRNGVSASINSSSTKTIVELGLIVREGYYALFLYGQASGDGIASAYIIRYFNGNFYRTVMAEGSETTAPRIDSNGVLKLNGAVSLYNVHWAVIQLG